jgi:hypothetical protein
LYHHAVEHRRASVPSGVPIGDGFGAVFHEIRSCFFPFGISGSGPTGLRSASCRASERPNFIYIVYNKGGNMKYG